jgi:hypothetical protein
MVPEKPSGILRVSGRVYKELGKPTTAEEWHAALLLPDDCHLTPWAKAQELASHR